MPFGDYLTGLLFLAATLGALAGGVELILRRRTPRLAGSLRVLAFGTMLTVALLGAHLLPGAAGVLGRGTVLAVAALFLLVAWLVPSIDRPAKDVPPAPERPSGPIARAIALAGSAIAAVGVLAYLPTLLVTPARNTDTLSFHLPVVARWIQTDSLWRIDEYLPLNAPGNYPHTGDVMSLAAILPWHNDAFVRLVDLPFLVLVGIAVYALARELGSSRAPAATFGLAVTTMPIALEPALRLTLPDTVLLAGFGAGLVFLVRHFRSGERSELVLAALGLGVAFGTKWYGVSAVVCVLAIWAAAGIATGRGLAAVVRQGALLVAIVLAVGGFWLVRNLALSGSPLFPAEVSILGLDVFGAPRDVFREALDHQVADYLFRPDVLFGTIVPDLLRASGVTGVVLAIGAAIGVVLAVARGARLEAARAVLALAAGAALIAVAYSITPYTATGPEGEPILVAANSRYLAPAALPAAAIGAWAATRLPRAGLALQAGALLGVLAGTIDSLDFERRWVVAAVVAVGAIAAAAWLGRALRGPAAAAGLAAALALLVVAAGHASQQRFNDDRYLGVDPALDSLSERTPDGARVGIVGRASEGIEPIYPAFGPRLRNELLYVGEREKGALLRSYTTRAELAAALRRGDYDYLLVRRAAPLAETEGRVRPLVEALPPAEAAEFLPRPWIEWASVAGFEPVAESESLTLLRAPGGAGDDA